MMRFEMPRRYRTQLSMHVRSGAYRVDPASRRPLISITARTARHHAPCAGGRLAERVSDPSLCARVFNPPRFRHPLAPSAVSQQQRWHVHWHYYLKSSCVSIHRLGSIDLLERTICPSLKSVRTEPAYAS